MANNFGGGYPGMGGGQNQAGSPFGGQMPFGGQQSGNNSPYGQQTGGNNNPFGGQTPFGGPQQGGSNNSYGGQQQGGNPFAQNGFPSNPAGGRGVKTPGVKEPHRLFKPKPSAPWWGDEKADHNFNWLLCVITLAAGIADWFICYWMYSGLKGKMPLILLIGLISAVFFLIVGLVIYLSSNILGAFRSDLIFDSGDDRVSIATLLVLTLLIGGAGSLFQWLYTIDKSPVESTSYVFLIDNSGSMNGGSVTQDGTTLPPNDPDNVRYQAIIDIMKQKNGDFPYMVYGFSDDVQVLRSMAPVSAGKEVAFDEDLLGRGTEAFAALDKMYSDYESNKWTGCGSYPRVIFLTDGVIDDVSSLMNKYSDANISISTVLLGTDKSGAADMEYIARATGGVYYNASDTSGLANAMNSAATQSAPRDIFTKRIPGSVETKLAILRILFLTLLGTFFGFAAAVAYGRRDSFALIMISTPIMALVGAAALEIGVMKLGIPEIPMWITYWLLTAVTVSVKPKRGSSSRGANLYGNSMGAPGGNPNGAPGGSPYGAPGGNPYGGQGAQFPGMSGGQGSQFPGAPGGQGSPFNGAPGGQSRGGW